MSPRTFYVNIKNHSKHIANLNAIKPDGIVLLPLQPDEQRTLKFESTDHNLKMEITATPANDPQLEDRYVIKNGSYDDYSINVSKEKGRRILEIKSKITGNFGRPTTNVDVGIDEPPGDTEQKKEPKGK